MFYTPTLKNGVLLRNISKLHPKKKAGARIVFTDCPRSGSFSVFPYGFKALRLYPA